MKIGLISRTDAKEIWAGDLKALNLIKEGFEELNHFAHILSLQEIKDESDSFLKLCGVKKGRILFTSRKVATKKKSISYSFGD